MSNQNQHQFNTQQVFQKLNINSNQNVQQKKRKGYLGKNPIPGYRKPIQENVIYSTSTDSPQNLFLINKQSEQEHQSFDPQVYQPNVLLKRTINNKKIVSPMNNSQIVEKKKYQKRNNEIKSCSEKFRYVQNKIDICQGIFILSGILYQNNKEIQMDVFVKNPLNDNLTNILNYTLTSLMKVYPRINTYFIIPSYYGDDGVKLNLFSENKYRLVPFSTLSKNIPKIIPLCTKHFVSLISIVSQNQNIPPNKSQYRIKCFKNDKYLKELATHYIVEYIYT